MHFSQESVEEPYRYIDNIVSERRELESVLGTGAQNLFYSPESQTGKRDVRSSRRYHCLEKREKFCLFQLMRNIWQSARGCHAHHRGHVAEANEPIRALQASRGKE